MVNEYDISRLHVGEGPSKHDGLWKVLRFSLHYGLAYRVDVYVQCVDWRLLQCTARPVAGKRNIETA